MDNPTLSEFVWEYAKSHNYVSRNILSGNYVDKFFKIGRRDERKPVQKQLNRKISQMFVIMKNLGICNRFSSKTVAINRKIFEKFTLQEVLEYNWHNKEKIKGLID